ncbi:hypothetical protein Acr_02g0009720 [Actinidia rufa]|uniref:Retrotransposon gag domain-containing protein n=1 Tax=Actinidia rufa TaxID=165716 RepID=A0A7J0E8W9_9ERIC|nr:hypothetical protein Acr_02g0009720 [Actinidia rufa]
MAVTGSEVTEHIGIHERDSLPPIGKGKRGKSADIMSSLEARLQKVEFAMADYRDKVEEIDQCIYGLKGGHEEFHGEIQGAFNSLAESWKTQLDAFTDSLQAEIAAITEELKEVKGDWSLSKMAITQGKSSGNSIYPINSEHEARARLRHLTHKGTIQDYVKEFSELMLEIPDMTEKYSLFTFIDGLQSWAKLEVQQRGPQDLAMAISIVESLIDFKEGEFSAFMPKFQKSNHDKGGEDHEGEHKPSSPRHGRFNKDMRNRDKLKLACFLCDGNHFARDCPQRAKLSALI